MRHTISDTGSKTAENVMPQDVEFHIPFPQRVSRDLDRARVRNIAWLQERRLMAPGRETARYISFVIDFVAGAFHPQATGAELDLGMDQLGFLRHFDDYFDGPLGLDPEASAAVCRQFAAVARGAVVSMSAAAPQAPLLHAYVDVWSRSRAGMPANWCRRAGRDWAAYFMGYPVMAEIRRSGVPPTVEEYLRLRRRSIRPVVNLAERLSGYEVPAPVFTDDHVQRMITISEDVVTLVNDVQSFEKDEATGDLLINILFLLGRALGCPRPAAIEIVQTMVRDLVEEFLRLRDSLPQLAGRAGLAGADREHLDRFVADGLCSVMRGNYEWGNTSARYEATELQRWLGARPGLPR